MKRAFLSGAAVVSLLALADSASAQGMYFSVAGGGNWLSPVPYTAPNDLGTIDVAFQSGLVGTAALGFAMMPGFRIEGEVGIRHNNVTPFDPPNLCCEGITGGRVQVYSVMANAWYDFNPIGQVQPYVGGGIGVANIKQTLDTLDFDGNIDASQHVFAFQLGAGLGVALSPMVTLTADYRLFATSDANLPAEDGEPFGMHGSYVDHSLLVGARFNLGPGLLAPPPP
jgi:opacity protein-like surface antigen